MTRLGSRFSPMIRLALLAQVAAAACLVVALIRQNDAEIEGAYFNRAVGADDAGSFLVTSTDIAPWLAAELALVLAGAAAVAVDALRRERRPVERPAP